MNTLIMNFFFSVPSNYSYLPPHSNLSNAAAVVAQFDALQEDCLSGAKSIFMAVLIKGERGELDWELLEEFAKAVVDKYFKVGSLTEATQGKSIIQPSLEKLF